MAVPVRSTRAADAISGACLAVWAAIACACSDPAAEPAGVAEAYPVLVPAPPALPRLTRAHFDNTVVDVLGGGLTLPPQLEPDPPYDELLTVGASVAQVSPRGVELYEDAARSLAAQVAAEPARLQALLPCTPIGPEDATCLGAFVAKVGRRLWRRPLTGAETAAIVQTALAAGKALGTVAHAVQWALVPLLQAPAFLYRVERGEPDPSVQGGRRLTGLERAGRLAFFVWNGPPDDALLDAAAAGKLDDAQAWAAEVDRLLAAPKARRGVRQFALEWLQLHELGALNKDPKVYKHFSPDLGASAREEVLRRVEHIALDQDGDLRQLLTSDHAFVDRRLAAIYEEPAVADTGFADIALTVHPERRGLLGTVAFLALASHPISTSPTLRGMYVRKHLLCDIVPNPPAGLNTALPEPSTTAKTMRERLQAHMAVKSCASCHKYLDPIGFAFERFDGIGRWRATDAGTPVDTSGRLDGATFADLASLGAVIAQSPKFRRCVVQRLYAFAVARPVTDGEAGEIDRLSDTFASGGMRLRGLMRAVARSDGFRRVGAGAPTGATP